MCRRLTGVLVAVILVIGCYEDDSSNLDAWQNAADVLETVGEVGETRLGPGFDQVSSTADVMEVPTLLGEELEDSVFRNEWGIDLAERATEIVTGDVTPLAAISTHEGAFGPTGSSPTVSTAPRLRPRSARE